MESSSYSKTRSPARFLAAFLAVVMLFIFMPVLPVGAATITKVTFVDVAGEKAVANFSDGSNWLDDMITGLPGGDGNWGVVPNQISYSSVEKSGEDYNSLTFNLKSNKLRGLYFYATSSIDGEIVLYAQLDEKEKIVLTKDASDKYSLPAAITNNEVSGNEVRIWAVAKPVTYNVTFTGISAYTADYKIGDEEKATAVFDNTSISVEQGKKLTLELTEVPVADSLSVRASSSTANINKAFEDIDGGKVTWTIENISENTIFQVKRTERKVKISFDSISGTGYTTGRISKEDSVTYGEEYTFVVTTTVGYKAPEVSITETESKTPFKDYVKSVNGQATTYSLHDIKKPLTIKIEEQGKETRRVEFPTKTENNGYKLSGTDYVTKDYEYGSELDFTVTRETGWTGTPTVTAFGRTWDPEESSQDGVWKYKLTVTDNTIVQISGFTRITHKVIVNSSEGISQIEPTTQTVNHGDGVSFRITLAAGYKLTNENTITLKKSGSADTVNGNVAKVEGTTGVYTITIDSVTDDLDLIVSGIEKIECIVTVTDGAAGENFKVTYGSGDEYPKGGVKVKYGEGVTFTITPAAGYKIVSVTATSGSNVQTLTAYDGNQYSVSKVEGAVTVKVTVKQLVYTITYNLTDSVICDELGKKAEDNRRQITKTYTVGDEGGIKYEDGWYILTLAVPKRKGWDFKGWKDARFSDGQYNIRFQSFTEDVNGGEFEPIWTVDVTNAGEEDNNVFFKVILESLKRTSDGVTKFIATISTNLNLDEQNEAGEVQMLCHGFLYAKDSTYYDNVITNGDLGDIASKLETGTAGKMTNLGTGVFFYKHDDTGANIEAYKNGYFKLNLRKTDNESGHVGAAWVLVKIKGETYLFISGSKTVEMS